MSQPPVERTLWYEDAKGRASLKQAELRLRTEPLVILGEAGMGKTTLLKWLAGASGFVFCNARRLVYHPLPDWQPDDSRVLVIDALDELSVSRDGDAVDLVLRRLGQLSRPRFVLSCRVADWRSATGAGAILDLYDEKPLVLHLEPFDDNDTLAYLGQQMGPAAAGAVVEHFTSRGLQGFLGNPQTLYLVTRIAGQERLPSSRAELFERAIDVLRREHNDAKSDNELSREAVLNTAGAAFAGLIITGNEAIVRRASGCARDGDLQLAELSTLAPRDQLDAVLRTRLFRATGTDRFSYWHRSIGEYLAARWLRTVADTPRRRRRLMRLFHRHGLVPSSLRGVHAWLARDPALARAVITADPVGVVEYGDSDDLTIDQARSMLDALSVLAIENPYFTKRDPYFARGIAHPALVPELRRLINADDTPVRLRQFILEAVDGTRIAPELSNDLRTLMLDPDAVFINRSAAGRALIESRRDASHDWQATMRTLHALGDELSVRLAIELMDRIGYEPFDDALIADLVVAYGRQRDRTVGVLLGLERHLPDSRIGGVLDRYTQGLTASDSARDSVDGAELTEFAHALIARQTGSDEVDVKRLWSWLQPLDASAGRGSRDPDGLARRLQQDHSLRLDLFRHVLLERSDADTVRSNAWVLYDRCRGIWPTPEEVIALLGSLDPSACDDQLWRELVQLTHHDDESGTRVRAAARPFTRDRPDVLCWLDSLTEPPAWKGEQARRDTEYRQRQADQRAESRTHFLGRIDEVRQGHYGAVINLAKGYLGLYREADRAGTRAHERIAKWLGSDVSEAASAGFEAFLTLATLHPGADEIAASAVKGEHWTAAYIIVAALAERHWKGLGFADLRDAPLLAGLFELRYTRIHEYAELAGLEEAVESEIRSRGLWEDAMRRYYEPQLEARYANANLHGLMRNDRDAALATAFAIEWLARFPDLPVAVEEELIDRLIASGRYDVLRPAAAMGLTSPDQARRRNWLAVGLIMDFEATVRTVESAPEDADLLWHL